MRSLKPSFLGRLRAHQSNQRCLLGDAAVKLEGGEAWHPNLSRAGRLHQSFRIEIALSKVQELTRLRAGFFANGHQCRKCRVRFRFHTTVALYGTRSLACVPSGAKSLRGPPTRCGGIPTSSGCTTLVHSSPPASIRRIWDAQLHHDYTIPFLWSTQKPTGNRESETQKHLLDGSLSAHGRSKGFYDATHRRRFQLLKVLEEVTPPLSL